VLWASDLGFDIGTSKTTVYARGQGVAYSDESVIALSSRGGNTVAIGHNASGLARAEGAEAVVVRPIVAGTIADFAAASELLRQTMIRALGRRWLVGPTVVSAVPPGATSVERYTLQQALIKAGARRAFLVDASLAAALGAGFGVNQPAARMIVDIGAGSTNIGIVSGGAVLLSRSLRFGGQDLDEAIRRLVRRKFGLATTRESAEQIKIRVGSVARDLQKEPVSLDGVEVYGELFKNVSVPLDDVPDLLSRHVSLVASEIRWLLEDVSREHREDLMATGIALSGGTSRLRGIAGLMTEKLGIAASVVPNPAESVISGIGVVLQNPGRLRIDGGQFYASDQ